MIRRVIHTLADSRRFTEWLSRRGMEWDVVRRFVAGESLDEVIPSVRALCALGVPTRLCKVVYDEPEEVAFQDRSEVDASFSRLADMWLADGTDPAFATRDPRMIDHVVEVVDRQRAGHDEFEFQMLYDVRRDAQLQIVADGFNVRIYVPVGSEWCPYFMRRIAERPANALFVARALLTG